MKPQFLIAAPSSNSGKTTVCLGILRLLSLRGYKVQPFKCGPDYIDPKHHTQAAGRTSINLDTFMMSGGHVKGLYSKYGADADALVTEGVMGLFDGADRMAGSSAEIALLLDIPVVLVVNARAMAYSAAPLLYGFKNFHPGLKIAGVIFNYVNSASHYEFLKQACEDVGMESFGYLPVNEEIRIPSRHLGLDITSATDYEAIIQKAAQDIEKTVAADRLLEVCSKALNKTEEPSLPAHKKTLSIAVARDEAFSFTYQQNIEALKELGEVSFFSPMHDAALPHADLVYLAGGYPELYLDRLAANTSMKQSVLDYCRQGGKVLAECGGMMYLGKEIVDKEGKAHAMAGVLGLSTSMERAKLHLGYRELTLHHQAYKGHEFHYSHMIENTTLNAIGCIVNARKKEVDTKVVRQGNVVASYIHFYWGEHKSFLQEIFQ